MLNWIDKNERLPKKEDASEDGYVYAVGRTGKVVLWHPSNLHESLTHWLPFREMPIPKRWRTPTIHDLAKAGKPIACRVRDYADAKWQEKIEVHAISVKDEFPFYAGCTQWKFCEICDD